MKKREENQLKWRSRRGRLGGKMICLTERRQRVKLSKRSRLVEVMESYKTEAQRDEDTG